MNPEVTLLYVHSKSMGYGRAGTMLADALTTAGVDVFDKQDCPPESELAASEGTRSKHTNAVCWVATPGHSRGWWTKQHTGIFTMWEATKLPESFSETLHEFDTLLVPSRQNVELFSRYNPNVRYVPLGVDPTSWFYTARQPVENEFRFLCSGSGERKGPDVAFKAFQTVFGGQYDGPRWTGKGPAPRLILKQPRANEGLYATWVDQITGRVSAEEERDIYAMAHCYVGPARGEGFGLMPLQAIAQGLPTILTNAHGHADYAHLGIPITPHLVPAGYFATGNPHGMEWWEPDFDEICEAMWAVYSNYNDYQVQAVFSAARVAREWTWGHSAQAFIDAFDGELSRPGPGQHEWMNPVAKLYYVRVTKDLPPYQINDKLVIFKAGVDYYQSADVKRILFESGLLDPVCLGEVTVDGINVELGLTLEQLEQVPHYRAEHAHCPTCGQELNTRPTLADQYEAEMAVS